MIQKKSAGHAMQLCYTILFIIPANSVGSFFLAEITNICLFYFPDGF